MVLSMNTGAAQAATDGGQQAAAKPSVYGIITEETPSVPQYFSWINNTNEGATEEHTLINLAFFKWLHDEYGMRLGIYAWDAGNIDSANYYGSMQTDKFKAQFPNGWKGIAALAKGFSCRLGLWGGPDGFGNTPAEEAARTEFLVSLCRDYGLQLYKFDAVCGQLRDEKQDAFANAMAECRKHAPDLIVLNHRLNLGDAKPHATTFLWGGAETYIDVHMSNRGTATHNRLGALSRGLPPELQRLTEDHGVCLSSCLDFWEDDLILQAFNRCLILAPEIYGNPWLLRDDEFPKLARIYNLHYRNREILVKGMVLPEERYGPNAVARGNANTRFVTLRNLTWNPVVYRVELNKEIGLSESGKVHVRRYHPAERILGDFDYGDTVEVKVDPFRSYLLMATVKPCREIGIAGCDYEVVRDTVGKPAIVKLLGAAGETAKVALRPGDGSFRKAALDGKSFDGIVKGNARVAFPGEQISTEWHRKLADLKSVKVPADAEQLYEATCFKAQNNALEVQSLRRSGPSAIPQVKQARKAFFEQDLFWRRGIWDRYMFDGREETFFGAYKGKRDKRLEKGALRLDLGSSATADSVSLDALWEDERDGEVPEEITAEVSADLKSWRPVVLKRDKQIGARKIKVANITHNGGQHTLFDTDLQRWRAPLAGSDGIRYMRITGAPARISELALWRAGKRIDSSDWHATILFAPYTSVEPTAAWQATVAIDRNAPEGSYLCVAINGEHGRNQALAAIRMGDGWIGASQRAPSFPAVVWEAGPRQLPSNNTYFFPITDAMRGKKADVVILGLPGGKTEIQPEVWTSAHAAPTVSLTLVLEK
jgi:hypothetical protein